MPALKRNHSRAGKTKKVGMNFQTHPGRHPDACVEVWVFRQLPNRVSALCCQKLFSAADNGDERCHRLPFPGTCLIHLGAYVDVFVRLIQRGHLRKKKHQTGYRALEI